ncbi:MAG: AAA family ATPase, partial [Nocardioidaceae bacterium]
LLSPLTPAELPEADAWLHLDCADDVRRRRLELRGWSRGRIDEALQDAAELRRVVPASVRGDGTPDEVAGRILDWAGRH